MEQQILIRKKRYLWLIPVCLTGLLLIAAGILLLTGQLRQYRQAEAYYLQGEYAAAAESFEGLTDYRDAAALAQKARYKQAEALLEQEDFSGALAIYDSLGIYGESAEQAMACSYALGLQALKDGETEAAIDYFTAAGDHEDAEEKRLETTYEYAHRLFLDGQFQKAEEYFALLEGEAEYDIPHFVEPKEALAYLKSIDYYVESVTVVVENMSPYYENIYYWNASAQQGMGYQFAEVTYDEQEQAITIVPDYYPGQRILWAWRSGDDSLLTEAEQQTYRKALALVEEAKSRTDATDPVALELWLHNWICDHVTYDSPYSYVYPEDYVGLRELTCVGAILDGKANCQGYTDAFHLLGSLAGLEVHKVFGATEGEGHCWNAVRLDDWLYTVDVTFNDSFSDEPGEQGYVWFNNTLDMEQYSVDGGVSQFRQMVFLEDLSQTYYARTDMVFEDMDAAALALLEEFRKKGCGVSHAVVEGDDYDSDDFYSAVVDNMGSAGVYSAQWGVVTLPYKQDTYIYVKWY